MIFIRGARQLLTLRGPWPRRGMQLCDLGMIPDGSVLIDGERIHEVGSTRRIENLAAARSARVIDATGKVVLPGFVDSHTRPLFAAPVLHEATSSSTSRAAQWPPALGIQEGRSSLLQTMSRKRLRLRAHRWACHFASHGTTTIETRSGGGLSLQAELKSLRIMGSIDQDPLDVQPAFLAAAPAPGSADRLDDLVDHLSEGVIPLVHRRRLAAVCDVECDPSAFSLKHSRAILDAARRLGFRLRLQSDRTDHSGGSRLAVEMNTISVEHLQFVQPDEIDLLARAATTATLLPALVYCERGKRFAPARRLLDRGVAVALATGFDPAHCPLLSMPSTLFLACTYMRMLPEETISAATINGAASMDLAHVLGSLEPGKQADLAIFDVADYREIPYYFGVNLCVMTIKKGRIIHPSPATGGASLLGSGEQERPLPAGSFPTKRGRRRAEERGAGVAGLAQATRMKQMVPLGAWAA